MKKTREEWNVVALAGGVGGAKLADGLARLLAPTHLSIVVNTGDDFTHYGLHISPDVDTVMYTLAGIANPATGWGMVNESWNMLGMMEQYGEEPWFRLGDRDLATHLLRTQRLNAGESLTSITRHFSQKLGIQHHILPATNDPLATIVDTEEYSELPFQHYFVKYRWQPTVKNICFSGETEAQITPEVQQALGEADLIIVCPSNPFLSIAPILAVKGIRQALEKREVPCLAVSPLISGLAIKGPTDKLMRELGLEASNIEIANFYKNLIDGLVIDTSDGQDGATLSRIYPALTVFQTTTLMKSIDDRTQLATTILDFIQEVYS